MKKYFALLTAILLTLLCSCTEWNVSPSPDSQQYTDNYLYTQIGGALHRISTVTASVTPVCPDPLCEHADASCPFFGVENIRMAGQYTSSPFLECINPYTAVAAIVPKKGVIVML